MRKFFLYKKETEKPCFVLTIGERGWIIPFLHPFETAKRRLAVEFSPDEAQALRPAVSNSDLIESGEVVVNSESGGRIDFTVNKSSGPLMGGNFVFVLPSWGRNTKRRLWIIVKSRKEKLKGGKNDKAHSYVEIEGQ